MCAFKSETLGPMLHEFGIRMVNVFVSFGNPWTSTMPHEKKKNKQLGFLGKNHLSVVFCWSGIKVSTHITTRLIQLLGRKHTHRIQWDWYTYLSIYKLYLLLCHQKQPNAGKYYIYGWYGIFFPHKFDQNRPT